MASNLTTYGATQALIPVSGAGLYLALGTGQSASGLVGEASGGGYARAAVGTINRSAGTATNAAAITFTGFTGTLGAFTHGGVYDASSAGNCLWVGPLASAVNIVAGGSVTIAIGDLDLALTVAA